MTVPVWDELTGWLSGSGDARLDILWSGALDYAPDYLDFVLHCAAVQCAAFAPAIPDGQPVPQNYVAAQALQARALARAGVAGSGDQTGGYGDTVTVFPMDWQVKNLLRPRKGRLYFGGNRVTT